MRPIPTSPVARRAIAALNDFNARHPWSHNDYFHRWILRRLPAQRRRALDAGCGRGELLAWLRPHFGAVSGVDPDPTMAQIAADRFAGSAGVTVTHGRFEDIAGEYDLVTMVAVLHHMDFDQALAQVRRLLAPGGKFLVVGLATVESKVDLAWDLASVLVNPVAGMLKHPRAAVPGPPPFPVKNATMSYADIRRRAASLLPGARLRRRLFFRYTLEWSKP